MNYDFSNLTDLELLVFCAKGDEAHRELARRQNRKVDEQILSLELVIEQETAAIQFVANHKAKFPYPLYQKHIDRIIGRMEEYKNHLRYQQDLLSYQRVSEEFPPCGPAMA